MPSGVQLGVALFFGFAGWHHARHLERKYGASAWGLPSWVWGIITGISLLLGIVLIYIAESRLKKRPQPAVMAVPSYAGVPTSYTPAPVAPVSVPAGWHPDPSGKHQQRWWDGAIWTSTVATDGVTSTDG